MVQGGTSGRAVASCLDDPSSIPSVAGTVTIVRHLRKVPYGGATRQILFGFLLARNKLCISSGGLYRTLLLNMSLF